VPVRAGDGGPGPAVERVLAAVRAASDGASHLIVLIGAPADTARAVDEVERAVGAVRGRRWEPRGPQDLVEGTRSGVRVRPWTLLHLDDLARFVLHPDAELAAEVAATLRGLLVDQRVRPLLIVAGLSPRRPDWERLTHPAASGGGRADAQAQALLRAATVLLAMPAAPTAPTGSAPPAPEPPASGPEPPASGPVQAGDLPGAERRDELAAMGGDLEALARLGRLREEMRSAGTGVDRYIDQAVAEGNTAVLFTLAAAGHTRALAELARRRAEAGEDPAP
jgi:hypothetical protein